VCTGAGGGGRFLRACDLPRPQLLGVGHAAESTGGRAGVCACRHSEARRVSVAAAYSNAKQETCTTATTYLEGRAVLVLFKNTPERESYSHQKHRCAQGGALGLGAVCAFFVVQGHRLIVSVVLQKTNLRNALAPAQRACRRSAGERLQNAQIAPQRSVGFRRRTRGTGTAAKKSVWHKKQKIIPSSKSKIQKSNSAS
jgi:hypothetical protein